MPQIQSPTKPEIQMSLQVNNFISLQLLAVTYTTSLTTEWKNSHLGNSCFSWDNTQISSTNNSLLDFWYDSLTPQKYYMKINIDSFWILFMYYLPFHRFGFFKQCKHVRIITAKTYSVSCSQALPASQKLSTGQQIVPCLKLGLWQTKCQASTSR